jgi:Trk K+ transport system NAD-binding subunit
MVLPDGETEIQPGDTIYAVGKHAKVIKFDDYLNG